MKVKRTTLDSILPENVQVGVCKVDVEGHEFNVLKGAETSLRARRIRDIIFEDLQSYPSPVHQMLLDYGYTLFALHMQLLKPHLEIASKDTTFQARDGLNYLATLQPERARERFKRFGWQSLRPL